MKKGFSITLFFAFFLLWMLPGLLGRDLWKADEPYSFGIIFHIVQSGDLVVPTLAGEPFLEKPPLYYLTAAASARQFSPWLQLHDAARLINIVYMALTFAFISITARELSGRNIGGLAALLLMGTVALQLTAHKLITDVALLAGLAIALYGLALARRRAVVGGIWTGLGTGIGFLSKGLLAPGLIGMIALGLPIFFPDWRRKAYFLSWGIAAFVMLPWFAVWPYALYQRSPELFREWFWNQNLGRFFGFGHTERSVFPGFYVVALFWLGFPVLPLALRSLWNRRHSWREEPTFPFSLMVLLVMLTVFSLSSTGRSLYALPMMLPLTLLAAADLHVPAERAVRLLNRIGTAFFGLVAGLLWLGWIVTVTGYPSAATRVVHFMGLQQTPLYDSTLFVLGLIVSLGWYGISVASDKQVHPAVNWTAGVVLIWGLLVTLWLPWLDAGQGYRAMMTSLGTAMPNHREVVASRGLGESERAALEYYTGVRTRRLEIAPLGDAKLLLVQNGKGTPYVLPGERWRQLWEGARPSKQGHERFQLFERIPYSTREKPRDYADHRNYSLSAL